MADDIPVVLTAAGAQPTPRSDFYVYVLYRDVACTVPFYVGKGHGDRMYRHEGKVHSDRRRNLHKNNMILKCIKDFGHVPKEIFRDKMSEADAFRLEKNLISWWGRANDATGILTNKTEGGEGFAGAIYSAEQRARMSAAQKGKKYPPKSAATREKLRLAHLGKPKSESHKEKIRQANLGKVQSPEARAKNAAANTGRIFSPETCRKLSTALTGRIKTDEHAKNISLAKKGKRLSQEVYDRQAASRAKTMAGKPGPNAGRVFSAESRERMRQSQLRRWGKIAEATING